MSLIKKKKIKIKPKWQFVLNSLTMITGLTGVAILTIFSISLVTFSWRTHGRMKEFHYQQLLASFPWWALGLAIIGIGISVWLLKKFDFSYKKNFVLISTSFILAILLAGWLINYSGLDVFWIKHRPMRQFYQRYNGGMMNRYKFQVMPEYENHQRMFRNRQVNQ